MGREQLRDLPRITKEAFEELCARQLETFTSHSSTAMEAETVAYKKWKHLAELEEGFLKQCSKLHWLNVGDGNNVFFHRIVQT